MARYFFNLNGHLDEEGTELTDDEAAKRHSIICAGQIMLDNPRGLVWGKDVNLEVADVSGSVLLSINVCVIPVQVA